MHSHIEFSTKSELKSREQEPIDYNTMELISPLALEEFIGKPIVEVREEVKKRYGAQYHIPGVMYEKYLLQHPEQVPIEMKNGDNSCFYFMADLPIEDNNGNFFFPRVDWPGLALHADYSVATILWNKNCRVLLLRNKEDHEDSAANFAKA
jgi:hypothetical protein